MWRNTLDHFDAVKIGLTATPAAHTTAYFTDLAFEYRYEQAVRDGYLVDYDAVKVRSEVRVHGVFLREGEHVEVVDPDTGLARLDTLEDERAFTTSEIGRCSASVSSATGRSTRASRSRSTCSPPGSTFPTWSSSSSCAR